MNTNYVEDRWCEQPGENLGPRGVRTCRRAATEKMGGKYLCTFHANKLMTKPIDMGNDPDGELDSWW